MPALFAHSNCFSVMGLRLKRGCCCIRARSITWLNCIRHRATQRCSLLWQAHASKSSVCMQAALRALQSSLQVPKHWLHAALTTHRYAALTTHTRAALTTHTHTLHSPHPQIRCTRHTHRYPALVTQAHRAMLQVQPLTETCFNLCSLHSRNGQHHEALSFARAAINIAETSVSPLT